MLNAGFVMNQCARFTALLVSRLKVLASILQINKTTRRSEQDLYQMSFTRRIHFFARSPKGFRASLKGVACSVAIVIGISLSIAGADRSEASIDANKSIKSLAAYQLTDAQYKCHNEIVHRESRWQIDAIGNKTGTKRTHGYYQIKSEHIKGKPYDVQFWAYWHYVSKRYGITKYDEPNYCNALHHLKTRGWQ
jgi:hypothetical protein